MRNWLLLSLCTLLAACAGPQPLPPPADLFDDSLFVAPSERIGADDLFAPSEAMREYLQRPDVVAQMRRKGPQRGLLEALYQTGELKIEYDASRTRNAAQAFDARAGNCLSLVVMTAAFARELGLTVRFRAAVVDEMVTRNSNLLLRSGHVNVTLARLFANPGNAQHDPLTVDFLPPEELKGLRTREISEATVAAMYMNNRAVEALLGGRLSDAYAWAGAAIRRDPDHLAALNTLGVVYMRRDSLAMAARVFDTVLGRDTTNRTALANLAGVYTRLGRAGDAAAVELRLARLEPVPPLHEFDLGLAAMKKQDFGAAREHFQREVARAGGQPELHYWLGLASLKLGDVEQARQQMAQAMKASASAPDRDLYAAKLDWLKAQARQ